VDTSDGPAAGLAALAAATQRLLATVAGLDDEQLRLPSALPAWSRLHVLTHLARNADGLRNRLLAARTGATVEQYPSAALRAADIEVGARRDPALVRLDLEAACERFAVDADSLTPADWARQLREPSEPASGLVGRRLREVVAHHVDLAAGYTFADAPEATLLGFFDRIAERFAGTPVDPCTLRAVDVGRTWQVGAGGGPSLSGPLSALVTWATGRGMPEEVVSDRGDVPASPGWG
jgi:maleylpyruvate isomerase